MTKSAYNPSRYFGKKIKALSHLDGKQSPEEGSIQDDVGVRAELHLHM